MPPVKEVAKAASSANKAGETAKGAKDAGDAAHSRMPSIDRLHYAEEGDLDPNNPENSKENKNSEDSDSPSHIIFTGDSNQGSLKGKGKGKIKFNGKLATGLAGVGLILIVLLVIGSAGSTLVGAINAGAIRLQDIKTVVKIIDKVTIGYMLENGSLPSPLADRLTEAGLEVGYLDNSGTFVAGLRPNSNSEVASLSLSDSATLSENSSATAYSSEKDNSLVLRFKDTLITSANWQQYFEDPEVYKAIDEATYGLSYYYYDEPASNFFTNINASRNIFNNYTSNDTTDFREILAKFDYNRDSDYTVYDSNCVNGKPLDNCSGKTEQTDKQTAVDAYLNTLYENTLIDPDKNDFNKESSDKIYDKAQATAIGYLVNNAVNANETYESMRYALLIAEVASKTMAGKGSEAPTNEMLNYMTTPDEDGISAVQSESLAALLTDSFDSYNTNNETAPYSLDRIQEITKQYVEVPEEYLAVALNSTSISWDKSTQSSYGVNENSLSMIKLLEKPSCPEESDDSSCQEEWEKYKKFSNKDAHPQTMALINQLSKALSADDSKTTYFNENGFSNIIGSQAGEKWTEGMHLIGAKMASSTNGATISTANTATAYQEETDRILAIEAAADRLDRSPFDISSQNTFLGNIAYSFSTYLYTNPSASSTLSSFSSLLRNSFTSILPGAFADNKKSFRTTFGDCPEAKSGYDDDKVFVCSSFSYPIVTFDTEYVKTMLNDPDFDRFLSENIDENGGVKKDSTLDKFIAYNNNRTSNVGYKNSKIASEIWSEKGTDEKITSSIGQFGKFLWNKVTQFGSDDYRFADYFSTYYARFDEDDLRIISGEAYLNDGSSSWTADYQKAQAYCVLARFLALSGYFATNNSNKTAINDYFTPGTGKDPYAIALKESSVDFTTLSDSEYLAAISGMTEDEANVVLGYFAYESYIASIDYENRLAFGKEAVSDFEDSIQFENENLPTPVLAIIKNDNLKVRRKDPTYVA